MNKVERDRCIAHEHVWQSGRFPVRRQACRRHHFWIFDAQRIQRPAEACNQCGSEREVS